MLRLRFGQRVPENAVNVAYASTPVLDVSGNVSLLDMSYKRAQNLSSYVGGELNLRYSTSTNRVDTDEIVISPRAVRSRLIAHPAPLYYKYMIGRGVYGVRANVSDPTDTALAREEILKQLEFLDRMDNKIPGPDWDIEVPSSDGSGNFQVIVYLARRQRRTETFKIKYHAGRLADNQLFPNHIEVINAVPILEVGTDYTLTEQTDGYSISGLSSVNMADGLAVFYKGSLSSGYIEVGGGTPPTWLKLKDDNGVWHTVYLYDSIQEAVRDINELGIEYVATALSDNPVARLQTLAATTSVPRSGRVVKQDDYIRVKYTEETRVRPLRPYRDSSYMPWYPRIDMGQFSQDSTYNSSPVKLVFKPQGSEHSIPSGRFGASIFDRVGEKPQVIGPKMLALRRPNMLPDTLRIFRNQQELLSIVQDYDSLNSVVFLNRILGDARNIEVDYSHESDSYIYTGIDLNPLGWHSPELLGKYVGVYMTPAKILGSSPASFSRTIYHCLGDNVDEIQDWVDQVVFDTGDPAHALLLGIYRVGQKATIEEASMIDTRSRGGGLSGAVEPRKLKNAEEACMFWDVSYWDGDPFPPTAVIVEVPSNLLGTGEVPLRADPTQNPTGFHYPSGLLTTSDLQAKVDRYKAGGVIAIVNPRDDLNG